MQQKPCAISRKRRINPARDVTRSWWRDERNGNRLLVSPSRRPLRPLQARPHSGDRGQGGRVQQRERPCTPSSRRRAGHGDRFLDEEHAPVRQKARRRGACRVAPLRGPFRKNAVLLGGREGAPGSTFWMSDQSLLAGLPASVPAPGASGTARLVSLPALKSTFDRDLDPQLSMARSRARPRTSCGRRTWPTSCAGSWRFMSLQAQQSRSCSSCLRLTCRTSQQVLVSARSLTSCWTPSSEGEARRSLK